MSTKAVGLPNAFTCWSPSVRILDRFLREAGVRVVTTPRTTPAILKAATTFCSADFCMPVRVLVGHVHTMAVEHPELDAIIVPNVCQEHPRGSNCSKYRDVSGIVIRSLAGTVGYLAEQALPSARARLEALIGREELDALRSRASALPRILQPEIWSLDPEALFRVCYGVYCDIQGLGRRLARAALVLPDRLRALVCPHYQRCRAAFDRARDAVLRRDQRTLDSFFRDPSRPRLAVVGRAYLHDDPLVSADLKPFFRRRRCDVITPQDVPFELLREGFDQTVGFYETHRLYQSFLDLVADRVDGVVVIGAFGCHPDAFENTYFLEYVRALGLPAWLLKFDEQSSNTGFVTRYETILGVLEQRRDARVAAEATPAAAGRAAPRGGAGKEAAAGAALFRTGARLSQPADGVARLPVLVWPHMSPVVDAMLEEILYQAGLSAAALRPQTLSTDTVEAGNYKYTESCCPYALTTGSMILSVRRALEQAARDGRPRRIILIQGQARGPCTYGWYAQLQQLELPKLFASELRAGGHTMEMLTVGGANLVEFMGAMAAIGDTRRLQPLIDLVRAMAAPGGLPALPWLARRRLMLHAWSLIRPGRGLLTRTALAKVEALEAVRARSLITRAHERSPGEAAALWRQAYETIRTVHSVPEIHAAAAGVLRALEAVDQEHGRAPRVLVVGEIYVALASFANRGTVETLLGREGIEVVEATTVGNYLRTILRTMRRDAVLRSLRPLLGVVGGCAPSPGAPPDYDRHAKPFVQHHLGGDGRHSVSAARHAIEHLGIDGIVHVYPFKCMPEMMAKTALLEMARFYGVRYLPLDFDKETNIQRLRTEIATFAQMLKIHVQQGRSPRAEGRRRRALGRALNAMSAGQAPVPAADA